jgi:hypothetical protein
MHSNSARNAFISTFSRLISQVGAAAGQSGHAVLQHQRAGQSSAISYDFRPYYGCFGGESMKRVHAIFEELP